MGTSHLFYYLFRLAASLADRRTGERDRERVSSELCDPRRCGTIAA